MFPLYFLLVSPAANADTAFIASLYLSKKQSHMRLPVYQCSILFKNMKDQLPVKLLSM